MPHSFLSPSGAPAWTRCLAKPWREKDLPDSDSPAAREGTAAHFLMEKCLEDDVDAAHFAGLAIAVGGETRFEIGADYPVGDDLIKPVQKALDYIRGVAEGATVYPEQQLDISFITGEEGATGTADAVAVKGSMLHVFDLKYGRGVQVFAEGNEQLLFYGAAALRDFDVLGELETVVLHIVQPRLDHYESWTVPDFEDRIIAIGEAAAYILSAGPDGLEATPGEKQCQFCKAKATCPELRSSVLDTVADGFVDLDKGFVQVSLEQSEKLLAQSFGVKVKDVTFEDNGDLGQHFSVKKPSIVPTLEEAIGKLATADDARLATLMDAAPLAEDFFKSVRGEVERRLLAGAFTDARYKLVEGRMGNREFRDEAEAEAEMKSMRLKSDEMYNRKIISPTQAEALLKEANPRKWKKLEALIVRREGKPSVAPASDKRPALSVAIADSFEVLDDGSDLV